MEATLITRIASLVDQSGFSQTKFAKRCNISPSNFNKMLHGSMPISEKTMLKIAETFGVNFKWLRNGIGEIYEADRRETDAQYAQARQWLDESEGKSVSVNTIHGDNNSGTQTIGASDSGIVAVLKEKIAMLERLLAEKDRQIADKDGYIKMLIGVAGGGDTARNAAP